MTPSDQPSPVAPGTGAPPSGWSVYVVDCHSLIFQVFHAIPEMTSPQGEPVSAVFGFTRDLLFLIEEKRPDALICVFDPPGGTFRDEIYDAYKAGRSSMPEDLSSQIPKIQQVIAALGAPVVTVPRFEADDVLATIARWCDEAGAECRLVTGDKDCRQLITDRVSVLNIRKNQEYDAAALAADWGIRPDQVCDFQALVGDKVDNIPGVPSIGPKSAKELLDRFGNLAAVLDGAEQIKGAKRAKLLQHRADAELSRRLVELDRFVPLDPDWPAWKLGAPDAESLSELMREYGFRGLGDRAKQLAQGATGEPVADDWQAEYRTVTSLEELAELVARARRAGRVCVDTETTAKSPRHAELVGVALAWEPGEAYYVPVRGPAGDAVLPLAGVVETLRPLLEDPTIGKIGQNLKYDLVVLRGVGLRVSGVEFDTMIASYLLGAGERNHGLDELSLRRLGHETIKITSLIGKGKDQKRMDEVPVAEVGPYAAEDADVPLRLLPILAQELAQNDLVQLNDEVETPLVPVLADLEYEGVRVDADQLAALSERFALRLDELQGEIETLAGGPFNIASPKQLADVLFNQLGLPVQKRTKTGPSTDADVLEALARLHPLPELIVQHRQFSKLKGTYVDALPELIHPGTGRVHCSLNQVVAATGRLSASDPNLQNIPVRTEAGREIRAAFTAREPGWRLLAADYSQIELRVLAHYSEDRGLCEAFASDRDIHTLVASQVGGVSIDEVTDAMRRGAKAVNFGIIYGQSPFGLARSLGIPKDEAARFISDYFERYPGVLDFIETTLAACRRDGMVRTLLGRKRAISGVRPRPRSAELFDRRATPPQLTLPERTAVNTVIQGTAADLIKLAMLAVHRQIEENGLRSRMILQIHDELLFDAPEEEIDPLAALVREQMQGVAQLRVPLKVDIKTGKNWAEC
ncbi:DNA polymerase I [Pirellulimonas nuda]|uniref:DNA polymerase I n=1 Tax=Pirellulimonas nuda TaxID=2528009 RepID=A0A518DAX9_9BACT|nr:DNA polymerase I [Pirellulimonas nuda]QDU88640.1 DNA polymerase I [Pirellulimonas nuda]